MSRNPRRVADRIQDMLEAIANIRSDISDMSREDFLADGKTQRAVIESLIVIGEAANRVRIMDSSLETRNPSLGQQLKDAYDMRIVLTHEYFRVDAGIVWTTIKNSVPALEAELETHVDGGDF